MPFDRSLYPADWEAISQRVKDRAGWKCQWPGCEAPQGVWIARHAGNPEMWVRCAWVPDADLPYRLRASYGPGLSPPVRIVITTSHRCYCVPICGNDEHLWALCQLHHLRFDTRQRVIAAAGTRRAEEAQAGQGFLFSDIDAESPRTALRSLQERSAASATEETTS